MKRMTAVRVLMLPVVAMATVWPSVAQSGQPLQAAKEGWEVSGAVTDEYGPIKDAWVSISGPQYIRPTRTDGQGRYSLKGKGWGLYSVRVDKKDNTSEPRSRSLTLVDGQQLSNIDFRIPRGGVVSGRVVDQGKQPIPGVVVLAMLKSMHDGRLQLEMEGGDKTNDLGEYRIAYLPDGVYVVEAISEPLTVGKRAPRSVRAQQRRYPPITFFPEGRFLDAALALEVRSGQERQGLDIVVQKEATRCVLFKVEGALSDPRTPSHTYLLVKEWVGTEGPTVAEGWVAGHEQYEICGLAPGEYRLHLHSATQNPIQGIGYGRAVAVVDKEDVDVGSLTVLPAGELKGTVTVKDAKPGVSIPPRIQIRLLVRDRGMLANDTRSGTVQANGTFVLDHVYVDDYGVQVDGLPAGYYLISAYQQGRSVLDSGLRPGNGDLQVTLGADGAVVRGRVLAEDNEVVPDATVFLIRKGHDQALAVLSDQTGAYQFTSGIEAGEYELVAVSDLFESQRRDTKTAARFAGKGVDLRLGSGESRAVDLRIQAGR